MQPTRIRRGSRRASGRCSSRTAMTLKRTTLRRRQRKQSRRRCRSTSGWPLAWSQQPSAVVPVSQTGACAKCSRHSCASRCTVHARPQRVTSTHPLRYRLQAPRVQLRRCRRGPAQPSAPPAPAHRRARPGRHRASGALGRGGGSGGRNPGSGSHTRAMRACCSRRRLRFRGGLQARWKSHINTRVHSHSLLRSSHRCTLRCCSWCQASERVRREPGCDAASARHHAGQAAVGPAGGRQRRPGGPGCGGWPGRPQRLRCD